jgi:hypothetical protein
MFWLSSSMALRAAATASPPWLPRKTNASRPYAWPQVLDFFRTPLVIEPSEGQLSGDAGLLPFRQFDRRVGLTRACADALDDPHDPDLTDHPFLEEVRCQVYGILAGHADQNDSGHVRSTPTNGLAVPRRPPRGEGVE